MRLLYRCSLGRWLWGIMFLCVMCQSPAWAQSQGGDGVIHTFPQGSLIIPMDTTYQDMGVLEAYGLLYHLLKANIPVHWVIKKGKQLGDADFTANAKDIKTNAVITGHGYRGGPFVVHASYAAQALPLMKTWQTSSVVVVHEVTASFQARTGRYLTAAPSIAVIADQNEKIAFGYLNAAKIPDSQGNPWPAKSDGSGLYPNNPDVLNTSKVSGPTDTNHSDGALFRKSGLPAYCQVMTMHWDVGKVVAEVVAEYRSFLKYPTHIFAHCQGVNAIENHPNGRFLTPKGFVIDNKVSGNFLFMNLDTPFAQMDGPFELVGGSERAYSLPPGDQYLTRNVVMITDSTNGTGQRDVWMTGYLDGKCIVDEDDLGCSAGVGKVSYLGGHQYETALPISRNPKTQGTRLFLNSLFEASCATSEGQPNLSLIKRGPLSTSSPQVTYTLYYTNFGPGSALDVVLEDKLPVGATYVSSTQSGTANGGTVTWKLGDLMAGQSGSVQVTVTLAQEGRFRNAFSASYRIGNSTKSLTSNEISTLYLKTPTGDGAPVEGVVQDGGPPEQSVPEIPPSDLPPLPNEICESPNLLVVLDRSGSMKAEQNPQCINGDCTIKTTQSCQNDSDCAKMASAYQPAPGTTARYPSMCRNNICHYVRWDVAQNTLKDIAYQYGGTAAQNYSDRKIRFGLLSFNHSASLDAPLVSNPPQLQTALSNLQADGRTSYSIALLESIRHLQDDIARDPAQGRSLNLLFITDGSPNEGCSGPLQIVRDLYQGTGAYRLQASDGSIRRVKTYVIGFGSSLDAGAQTCLNQLADAGGTRRCDPSVAGCVAYFFADQASVLKSALDAIIQSASIELCDGKDNDCDGQIDNGLTRPCKNGCGSGNETCRAGQWVDCSAPRSEPEVCDNKDNDCDGTIDNGLKRECKTACGVGTEICKAGTWEGCTAPLPQTEVCDGLDNDCNGQIDENGCACQDGSQRSCYTGDPKTRNVGVCRNGIQRCVGGKWQATCDGEVKPSAEVCDNGKDENCDGQVDEGCNVPACKDGDVRTCSSFCGPGRQTCQGGRWGTCSGNGATLEICDGKDNDCDGFIDENMLRACSTSCGPGIDRCSLGQWSGCIGQQPQQETCDGIDNDCDGKIDNSATCPDGDSCTDGICPQACRGGECPRGQVCNEGRCYSLIPCSQQTCGPGQFCRAGQCLDLCSELKCPSGFVCWEGACAPADCYTFGCPKGKVCQQGACVADPCTSLQCPADEACKAGRCVPTCQNVTCPSGQSCKEGQCQQDPCAVTSCKSGEVCYLGQCYPDPCKSVTCPRGRVCELGGCVDDPCAVVHCPTGLTCQQGACLDLCKGKSCPSGEACLDGKCVPDNCYTLGCPQGQICKNGQCAVDPCVGKSCAVNAFCRDGQCAASCVGVTCAQGERCRDGSCEKDPCDGLSCQGGQICIEGKCIPNACLSVTCDIGRRCDPVDGQCKDDPCHALQCPPGGACDAGQCLDACLGKTCPDGFLCEGGICVQKDCYSEGCPQGQVCRDAACVADPCEKVSCPKEEFCRGGQCVKSCAGIVCQDKERCEDGACKADACVGVTCQGGEYCDNGNCLPNPCKDILCGTGRFCEPKQGRCVDDLCLGIRCPDEQRCYRGQCFGASGNNASEEKLPGQSADAGVSKENAAEGEKNQAAAGCQCNTERSDFSLFLFLCLGLLWWTARRRRLHL
ncbi:MAG: DUF11 domain-containing protein [Myxococcales bacterium]|nr:DUF11 domain-containing protein [Myxococcales bacterium]